MILHAVSFSDIGNDKGNVVIQAISSFFEFLERKLGARVVFDTFNFPYGKSTLAPCFRLAKKMMDAGLITAVYPAVQLQDEPRLKVWMCSSGTERNLQTGGASLESEENALMAALAESLERQIWRQDDYFIKPLFMSTTDMQKRRIQHTTLESFASYSVEQRQAQKKWQFDETTKFLWVKGVSLISQKSVYVPAQMASGSYSFRKSSVPEPIIRVRTTNGLATWPTQTGARLAGMLELVERDAYLIMWFNQITLPRIDITSILPSHPSLKRLAQDLERYRFRMHCIPMLTDAPAHAICTVIEDVSGKGPRFTVGLKAHRSLAVAIEKSATEALRARYAVRLSKAETEIKDITSVGHYDRVPYWAQEGNAKKLEFLIAGEMKAIEAKPWDTDSEESHYKRVVSWLKESSMEVVSVPLTYSKKNVSDLHIEMVVIPTLHALHLYERDLALGGQRWQSVPKMYGIQARKEMFTAEPHPFS